MITTFGEIMLRITPQDAGERILQSDSFRIEPGGSESNVAIALANLGMETQFITSLPDNTLSDKTIRYLKEHNVLPCISKIGSRLGVYWTETGIGPRNSFVIYDRDNSAFSQAQYHYFNWNEILRKTEWFHFSGISPAVSESVASLLQRVVNECNCHYSVDLNYRKRLWNWTGRDPEHNNKVMTGLCKKAKLISGNESDFSDIFGIDSTKKNLDDKYFEIAEKALDKFPFTKFISISNRQSISATRNDWNGFLFVNGNGEIQIFKSHAYQLDNVIDRVGTGDSFVAGIIYGLLNFGIEKSQKTIDFATTLAALNHTTKGDASTFSEKDVFDVMKAKGSGRIVR
ncbi:MAG: sugar kinase [Bacteroidetes bacterium]|nr:sugar kinase [Bacteroidota bacterium]